jgi:hypothetical protein
MMRSIAGFLALAVSLPPAAVRGDDEPEAPPPTVIVIRPAASPVPALKYKLLPDRRDLIPGNAAIFYHRAIERQIEVRYRQQLEAEKAKKSPKQVAAEEESVQAWLTQPLGTLPRDAVRKYLESHAFSLREVELGARREFCDWEFQRRDEAFQLILSDVQETRALSRLLIMKTRLEISEGRIDSAIHWLQTGLALARHVGQQSSTLIQSLIAAAMTIRMADPLEDLIQAPGAPNLYWALANLPRPFLDLSDGLDGEKGLLEKEFPQIRRLESSVWSIEEARSFADDLQKKASLLMGGWSNASSPSSRPAMRDLGEHMLFVALVARAYPEAKRELIARGRPAVEVEAMPAIQVVAIHSYRLYEEARDDIFKWSGLPYWQAYKGMNESGQHPRAGWDKLRGGIPFSIILPAVNSVLFVPVRVERRLNVAQHIEAIRLYAANHNGSLPPSLEAITEAPVPLDPATGKFFDYKLDGSTATLTAPAPPPYQNIPENKIHYELKLAR